MGSGGGSLLWECERRIFEFSSTRSATGLGSYKAHGDVSFKTYPLIFGDNGRGKTTLCSVLRSMQMNEPAILAGRKTLGQSKPPVVVMKLASGDARFANGAWSKHGNMIRIFDAQWGRIWFRIDTKAHRAHTPP